MLAGTIARLEEPADKPLTDTTEKPQDLPALAVNNTQTDLSGDGVAQHCTAASRIEEDREEALVFEGGITTVREPVRREVVSDLVSDVSGSGVVVAERVRGSGRYPFPFDMVAAQTKREIKQYEVDVRDFAAQFDETELTETWLVGVEDGDGVDMAYNASADESRAGEASVGLGFRLSWEGVIAEGVLYRSGYLAIYSSWTAAVFLEFVTDAVLPHAYSPEDEINEQTTLPGN